MTNLNDKTLATPICNCAAEIEKLKAELRQIEMNRESLYQDSIKQADEIKELIAEIAALKARLLAFEGMTFSENAELTKLTEQNKAMEAALEFYADKKNWTERWKSSCDEECEGDVSDVIDEQDVDVEDLGCGPVWTYGGKRARECLKGLE